VSNLAKTWVIVSPDFISHFPAIRSKSVFNCSKYIAIINALLVKSANLIAHCESKVIFNGSVPRISRYSTNLK